MPPQDSGTRSQARWTYGKISKAPPAAGDQWEMD